MIKGFFSVQCLMLFVGIALGMSATADPWRVQKLPTRYAQLSLGTQPIDQTVYTYDTFGNGNVAEIDSIHYLGFMAQLPLSNDVFEYGWDLGAHVGYNSHHRLMVRVGEEASVDIDSSLWTGDFFFGSFLSVRPHPSVRLFYAVGPSIYWGRLSHDGEDNSDGLVIDTRSDRGLVDVGVYQRAGIEFTFSNGLSLGASVRYLNADLHFGPHGYIDVGEPHYSLLIGSQF